MQWPGWTAGERRWVVLSAVAERSCVVLAWPERLLQVERQPEQRRLAQQFSPA
jgi:hypothetical protein